MAIIEALKKLTSRVPGKVWLAVGGLLVAALWLHEHDARIRQQAGLQQLRNQTSAEVAALRKQAAHNMEQANVENAKAIAELEQRRQQAEQQNLQLAAQLDRLRKQAQIQAGEVATLPISEIVTRVAAQLGLKAEDVAPAPAADMAKSATSAPPDAVAALYERRPLEEKIRRSQTAATGNATLRLTSSGARKVETALVALNACRAESGIETRQLSSCQARAEADEAAIERLNGSVASLNQAIAAKDKIFARQETQYKAELRAARGTFLGRLARLAEHVAIGVGVGVALGVAVK